MSQQFDALGHNKPDEDILQFAEDSEDGGEVLASWKVLIVDDDKEIHQITRLALRDFNFLQHKLEFISAYSAAEARDLLAQHTDIALILLDVVMESDDAGLTLVRYIREQLHNDLVRIILRTGQPGQAPEQQVVKDYDINDYRAKTELTVQRLSTTVVSALRAFVAIEQLAQLNASLEQQVQQRTAELQNSNQQLQQTLAELEAGERAGKQVQFKMLPPPELSFGVYQFSHALYPSEFMSGDFVDYFAADEQKVVFYIADVSGHGVASAFVTVYLKRFINAGREQYRCGNSAQLLDPAAMLTALNAELLQEQIGKYIALFYAVLDISSGELTFANAGAFPWPLLLSAADAQYLPLKSTPAGMFDFSSYANQSLQLPPHGRLLLCSDGILDVLPQTDTEQKLAYLAALGQQQADIRSLLKLLNIAPEQPLPDDLTILHVKRSAL